MVTILLAYPMAYWIAFNGGRHKSTYLFLILLPFFVTFVIRTISWQFLLADDGIVLGTLKDWGLLPGDVPHPGDPGRGRGWAGLQLPAVHGAADLRGAGTDRPARDRGGPDLYATRREVVPRG